MPTRNGQAVEHRRRCLKGFRAVSHEARLHVAAARDLIQKQWLEELSRLPGGLPGIRETPIQPHSAFFHKYLFSFPVRELPMY